jgi:hypothetical protein
MPQPASCFGPNGVSRGDFTLGCEAAKQRLALSDARSRANADYRAGWNGQSPAGPAAGLQSVAPEAAFEGAVFCGPTPTHLTLKVLGGSDPAHRRAMYHLGGSSADRNGGQGAGAIEGHLDLSTNAIEFQPVTKPSQSDATGPLGLQGRSEDGGRTFTGRVTTNPRCTMFTLKRMN